jgi:hypothetical protein
MFAKLAPVVFVCGLALTGAMCSEGSSPTAPTPEPTPAPTPTPTTAAKGEVRISIVPNPVPFSGAAITDAAGCAGSKNTWFYEQVLSESGGAAVTFTGRSDNFDGRRVNNITNLNLVLPANGSTTIRSRWCSATSSEHTAQTTFTGRDASGNAVTATAGTVRLLKK